MKDGATRAPDAERSTTGTSENTSHPMTDPSQVQPTSPSATGVPGAPGAPTVSSASGAAGKDAAHEGAKATTTDAIPQGASAPQVDAHDLALRQAEVFALLAHDIRAPLAVMSGALEELTHPDVTQVTAEQKYLIDLMRRSEMRLSRLAGNLQLLSELADPQRKVAFGTVDLRPLVQQAVHRAKPLGDARCEWHVDLPEGSAAAGAAVEGDANALAYVLDNLLANAARFAQAHVFVRIVARSGGKLLLEVEDDGPGFPPELGPHLFQRLRRVDGRRELGAGIGLSLVRKVVELHRATVVAKNRAQARGAYVGIEFPAPR
jgi:signal transduction histidine kinase